MFNEHPWRTPIRLQHEVKTSKIVGGFQTWLAAVGPQFVCPFCLYRKGLMPTEGREPAQRFASAAAVEAHLTEAHPLAPPAQKRQKAGSP
jgi:hypothetical protein